jgi:glycine/D-amino acid oxidase-like deaminating enzyme
VAAVDYDVIVVGGGVIGLAAAWHAARAGARVRLVERFDFGHERGSSGGSSRFFRVMHGHPTLTRLAAGPAERAWRELEADTARALLTAVEVLFFGAADVPTPQGSLADCRRSLDALGIAYEAHDAASLGRRYPALAPMPSDHIGLVQPAAVIHADEAQRALIDAGRARGATLAAHEVVTRIARSRSGIAVTTDRATWLARAVIVAAGAWTNDLLAPLGVALDLEVWEMTYAHHEASGGFRYPMWCYFGRPDAAGEHLYYGVPPVTFDPAMKVGTNWTRRRSATPDERTGEPDAALIALQGRFLARAFHGVAADAIPGSARTCLYVMTADGRPVLDVVPDAAGRRDVAVFAGETGQSFKFAPLIGRLLTELVLGDRPSEDIGALSIARPGIVRSRDTAARE